MRVETAGDGDAAPRGGRARIILGALGAATAVGAFLAFAGVMAAPPAPAAPPPAGPPGLGLVVRSATNIASPGDVDPLVARFAARGVTRAFVQVKQDEDDEFASGTAFYPSRIAPVAPGFGDDRIGALIDRLSARGIAPMAWLPVMHDAQAARAHPRWRSTTIAPDGSRRVQPEWLCPFEPAVARHEAAIAAEVAARYPLLQGLYLDFIRYDDDYACASPAALAELERITGWRERTGRALTPRDIRRAGAAHDDLWTAWTGLRAARIATTIDTIRDAVEEVRPDFRIGAFVLPFSSTDYAFNTQAGQDIARMARAGLDEIVLMGYWDDWDKSPRWVRQSMDGAAALIDGEADLGLVLDGDMGVRRTRLTLEALGPWAARAGWFGYGAWSEGEFARLTRAVDGHFSEGPMERPGHVSVVVRVDTEPDFQPSYEAVRPEMIDALVGMFGQEGVHATFITVGRLAERQAGAIARAQAAGHEIGSHSYDHEQLDALPVPAQLAAVDGGLATLDRLGFTAHGFGAPRNSITPEARDRLMDWGLEYDGSAAYDPLTSLVDVHYVAQSQGRGDRILVLPFVVPNDWDAMYTGALSAAQTLAAWTRRLDAVVASGEPVFVLDVHQWAASRPEELEALRGFIRYAKACGVCRVETLREAAVNARGVLDRYELPAPTSGDATIATAPGVRP